MGNYFYKPERQECHSTPLCSTYSVQKLQSMNSVSGPLNEAVVSLNNICKSLLDAHADPITGKCSNYKQIREYIEYSQQCMKKVETKIEEKLRHLDKCMEQFIIEKENFEQQKKEKCLAMDNLKVEKKSAEESLFRFEAALEQAKKSLEAAKYALEVEKNRINDGTTIAAIGGALLVIPFIGWIAGPIMLGTGIQQINEATNAMNAAQNEHQKMVSKVDESIKKRDECKKNIILVECEIEKTNVALQRIDKKIEEVRMDLKDTGNSQKMVRRAVTLLSVLSGRVSVLENQTQRSIHWELVVKIMEDVMKAVMDIAEDRFFYTLGIQGLINTLKKNVGGLQALCNSPKSSEYASYY